jgi:hypothetical protein
VAGNHKQRPEHHLYEDRDLAARSRYQKAIEARLRSHATPQAAASRLRLINGR